MVNVLKLKGKMVEKKINAEVLAKRIGMDRATFYRRLSKSDDFTIKEVDSIVRELGLTMDETNAIFCRFCRIKASFGAGKAGLENGRKRKLHVAGNGKME